MADPLYDTKRTNRAIGDSRLVVVSNRVPLPSLAREPAAGGLAVAMDAVLKARGGLWFGWSGNTTEQSGCAPHCRSSGSVTYAVCDLSRRDAEQYYCGFANRTLWPICHYRLDLADLSECNSAAYFKVNELFACHLRKMLRPDDTIWVHDYHLIPLARYLRQLGCANRIGFFLHIPWPGPEVASALPCYQRLLRSFGAYDVLGFQTQADADNFRDCVVAANAGLCIGGVLCEVDGRWFEAGAFPIGIDTEAFARKARAAEKNSTIKRTLANLDRHEVIVGVDRLDYSKGLKHRVKAFSAFLGRSPEAVRRRVTMLQITPKSRSEVPEYAQMQCELAEEVGRINGTYGEVDWTPLHYINKAMNHSSLAGLYRKSRIGLVTPLRDGMNLVAKEYVAAQAPEDPGVLILSQFAGAAHELRSALIVNPYDIYGTADAIARAISMPLEERKHRWHDMMAVLRANSVHDWASRFLDALGNGSNKGELAGPRAESGVTGTSGAERPKLRSALPWRRGFAGRDAPGIKYTSPRRRNGPSHPSSLARNTAGQPLFKVQKQVPPVPVIAAGAEITRPKAGNGPPVP